MKCLLGILFVFPVVAPAQDSDEIAKILQKDVIAVCDGINKKKETCPGSQLLPLPQSKRKADHGKKCSDTFRRTVGKTTTISDSQGVPLQVSEVTENELSEISGHLGGRARRYGLLNETFLVKNVCAQRAHMVSYDLQEECGVKGTKIFAVGDAGQVKEKMGLNYSWEAFHVANVVYVRRNGIVEPMVIDKLLSDDPIPLETWKAKLNSKGNVKFRVTGVSSRGPADPSSDAKLEKADANWAESNIQIKINESSILKRK